MKDLRELLQDDKVFNESFSYCKHYFGEYITVKTSNVAPIKVFKLTRLKKKKNKIYLDNESKKSYIPVEKMDVYFPEASWICAVPTGEKDDGRVKEELNFLCDLLKTGTCKDMKKLKKHLIKKGLLITNDIGEKK